MMDHPFFDKDGIIVRGCILRHGALFGIPMMHG
jgi:hypothetical protein